MLVCVFCFGIYFSTIKDFDQVDSFFYFDYLFTFVFILCRKELAQASIIFDNKLY